MARRRYGSSVLKSEVAEETAEMRANRLLDDISHRFKLLDIKRRNIKTSNRRLPFLYVGLGIFGFFLAAAILAISPILIFLFGSLFMGVLGATTGPVGALTERKNAKTEIATQKSEIADLLGQLRNLTGLRVFGLKKATKTGVILTDSAVALAPSILHSWPEDGVLPIGDYRHLGFVFNDANGQVDLKHDAIRRQYWLTEAKLKGFDETALAAAVEALPTV